MKSRFRILLLLVTAAYGFYAVSALAGAQDAPTPPTPPALPSSVIVPPVPPFEPRVPINAMAPAEPAAPQAPAMPAMPAIPAAPAAPSWGDWDHRHSVSMSGRHHEPASDCSDLHVRFDDRDAVMEKEERTVRRLKPLHYAFVRTRTEAFRYKAGTKTRIRSRPAN